MLTWDLYEQLRKYARDGRSARWVAKKLQISRNTVRKYWNGEFTPDDHNYPSEAESQSKRIILDALRTYFEENSGLPGAKQQPNAKTAYKALRDRFNVGESTIRRYVHELKETIPEVFIPLEFEPGEVMQVDWCEIKASIGGNIFKVPVFCAVLPYSYDIFATVLPNMKTPCLIAGHVLAMEHFGGVCDIVFYDNMSTAVKSGYGRNAVKQEGFKKLEAHYAYESRFMNIASGNEKGAVENLCGLIRGVAFTPMPKVKSLRELQEHVYTECLAYRNHHKIKGRQRSIAEMYEEERGCLKPLPLKSIEGYERVSAVVGSDLTFVHDATKYSVPHEYGGKTITAHFYPFKVDVWCKGTLICTHERPFAKGEHQYIPEHYLPILEKKTRAIEHALPLKRGIVTPELDTFRRECAAKDKMRQLAEILLLARTTDSKLLLSAVDFANKTGLPTYDLVVSYLKLHDESFRVETAGGSAPEPESFKEYDALLWGNSDKS